MERIKNPSKDKHLLFLSFIYMIFRIDYNVMATIWPIEIERFK